MQRFKSALGLYEKKIKPSSGKGKPMAVADSQWGELEINMVDSIRVVLKNEPKYTVRPRKGFGRQTFPMDFGKRVPESMSKGVGGRLQTVAKSPNGSIPRWF